MDFREKLQDRGYRWGQWQNQGPWVARELLYTPPPRRGLGRPLVGGWGRPLPKMGRAQASRTGCPRPQGGPAGGGQAGAAAPPAHVAEPLAGPGGRECRAGWKKALEAERPCLCWQLVEAPPAFHSPPFPSLAAPLPSLKSQKRGGRLAEHFVSGARAHLASPAKPQVQAGRWVGDTQPSDGGRWAGAVHRLCGHCSRLPSPPPTWSGPKPTSPQAAQ